jgi:hypothetical protein
MQQQNLKLGARADFSEQETIHEDVSSEHTPKRNEVPFGRPQSAKLSDLLT